MTQVEGSEKRPKTLRRLYELAASISIRGKIVLPYLILTLLVTAIGLYVVTNLVVTSLDERLTNQLLEAGRVVSDSMARWEMDHLESARAVAFTVGLTDALKAGDRERAVALAQPAAAVRSVESLIITNAQGQVVVHGMRQDDGTFEIIEEPFDASGLWMVQALLDAGDPNGLPKRSLGIHLLDQRYYYLTAIPIPLDEQVTGVVIVGTSLDTLLPHLKLTSLADVTIYHNDGKAIGSTFTLADPPESKANTLAELSITPESYQSILSNINVTTGENVETRDRSYRLARGPLRVGNDSLGVFSVALPTNFIVEQRATNRNVYIAVFVTTMLGVVIVGYVIAQLIIRPLSSLVQTSQAVADGNLEQRTGIVRGDEIGFLAETFDEMTGRLADRTRALEETLGRMKAILSSIGDGVLLEDLEQNLIPLNAAAEFMLQEMADNFLLGPLRELTSENPGGALDQQPTWPADQRRFEVGKKVLSAHSAAVRTEDGEHLGTVIVLRDVTAEAEADRVKNAFVAHVSHELRTPLTAIKGYSELMLIGATGLISSEQQGFLKTIHHHTESLVNMINTLLDFSEIEAWDRLKLNRYPVQLSTLVEETVEPWYPEMKEKGLDFKVDISENLPVVNADNKRLTWVIVNLIRNAWQYTPSGGCVTVRLYEQNGNIVLDVQDTGVGISKGDQQKLFSRFYRVADTTQIRGIGLGLYVAKAIIDGHEGKIQVRSEEGAGSTFSVIMPVLKE